MSGYAVMPVALPSAMQRLHAGLRFLAMCCCALMLSACVPMADQEVNTDLFKNKEEMKERAAMLKPGMYKDSVFEKLGIPIEKFTRMSTAEVQLNIYGNSMVQGTPEQLEQFRQRLMGYEGYALPYRDLDSRGSLGFGSIKVNKTGHDLRMVLIFDRDRLMKSSVDGNEQVSEDSDQYLWGSVLKKTTGIGF